MNACRRERVRGFVLALCVATAALVLLAPGASAKKVTVDTVRVSSPGNASVGIVPFTDAIYESCAGVDTEPACQTVGGVGYDYRIGELEVTVKQYVAFLNTVDPKGQDAHDLYSETESSKDWPRFGQINRSSKTGNGKHYSVAYPEWADKPYAFADFLRAARFVNSLYNGELLSKETVDHGGWQVTRYRVRLSTKTERGMYDLATQKATGATRAHKKGFVVPSQDEWIKAAYFDGGGGGTFSYWKYPTNAGVFGNQPGTDTPPNQSTLDPGTGDVTNAASQPLATFHASSDVPAPSWCPSEVQPQSDCTNVNPFGLDPTAYAKAYAGSVGTVGQAATRSPWGTLDQGGNVVEWTDTITAPPTGRSHGRVWRRLHGGIANAPVYQLWLSAVGLNPQDNAFFTATYPWLGFRVGVVGNLKPATD